MAAYKPTTTPVQGQCVFTCGHSFHAWVTDILVDMAQAAGISNHHFAGLSCIGGSQIIQHWDVPEEENEAKKALRAGAVDVLTLSPIWLPDEGIYRFAALALEHNPEIRVTVQEFWLPNDVYEPFYPLQTWKQVNHNATVLAELRKHQDNYFHDMDSYVRDLNKQLGKDVVLIVPVGQAVLMLREKIVAGKTPGLAEQAELFTDSWGHPTEPLKALAAYCHFSMIYRRSPQGLRLPKCLAGNPSWNDELNHILQDLAWNAVIRHPLTGTGIAIK